MKNKRGFTLVELLSMLVVLAIVLTIAFPLVTSYVKKTKQKAYDTQINLILSSLRNHANSDSGMLPQNNGEYVVITLGQLKGLGVVENSIVNPVNSKEIEDYMEFKITKKNNRYIYEVIENSIDTRETEYNSPTIELVGDTLEYYSVNDTYQEKGYKAFDYDGNQLEASVTNDVNMSKSGIYKVIYRVTDNNGTNSLAYRTVIVGARVGNYAVYDTGDTLYFNPTTGNACTASEAVSVNGTKSGCMKWHVFLDDAEASKVKLILAHNTTSIVAWNSNNNATTANEVQKQLQNDTQNWKQKIDGETIDLTARFISVEEIVDIIQPSSFNKNSYSAIVLHNAKTISLPNTGLESQYYKGGTGSNKYAWLFDNLVDCSVYGCNKTGTAYGYWTNSYSGKYTDGTQFGAAWAVNNKGGLITSKITNTDSTGFGVRPVIEIDKSLFNNYEIVKYKKYNNGEVVYFDPTTGFVCNEENVVTTEEAKSGCMKWYAFLDSENSGTVKLILDHNTTSIGTKWNSDTSATIPNEILTILENDTKGWKQTIDGSSHNMIKRLITAEEVNLIAPAIGSHKWIKNNPSTAYFFHTGSLAQHTGSVGSNTYAWLFDNLSNCSMYGCNKELGSSINSYWTNSFSSSSKAWIVNSSGELDTSIINLNSTSTVGLRPVIEISKSVLQEAIPTYTLTLVYNDGATSNKKLSVEFGSTYGELPTPTRPGYEFKGWALNGGTVVTSESKVTIPANHNLYAQWLGNTYVLTYDSKGGNNIPNQNIVYGSAYGTLPIPTKTGYTFSSWKTSSGANITSLTKITTVGNHTLYANWTPNAVTVTFDTQGGNNVSTINRSYLKTYGVLPTPTKTGKTFKGWSLVPNEYQQVEYIESTGSQYINTKYFWMTEDIEIYLDAIVVSNSSNQSLFGNEERYSGSNRYFAGIPHGSNGSFSIFIGNGSQTNVNVGLGKRFSLRIRAKDNNLYVYKDEVQTANKAFVGHVNTQTHASLTSNSSTTVGHIFLFANHNSSGGASNSATQYIGGMKVYAFKLYDNGTMTRNLIPCYRKSDKVVGMYDTVGKVFYTTPVGSFNKGNDVYITSESSVTETGNHTLYAQW